MAKLPYGLWDDLVVVVVVGGYFVVIVLLRFKYTIGAKHWELSCVLLYIYIYIYIYIYMTPTKRGAMWITEEDAHKKTSVAFSQQAKYTD
jgi:hypothetical protein